MRGYWEIKFVKLYVEGKDIKDFQDLSETSQEHISQMIKEGYTSGELNEEGEINEGRKLQS